MNAALVRCQASPSLAFKSGSQIRCEIRTLERLVEAYRNNDLRQSGQRGSVGYYPP